MSDVIIGKHCLRLIEKATEKIIDKPYPDKRFKKGFVMRPFNPETGQFTHTTYRKYNESSKN